MRRLAPFLVFSLAVIAELPLAVTAQSPSAARTGASARAVPEPQDVFGFRPGTDYKLAGHYAIVRYFRALDAASDRVIVEDFSGNRTTRDLRIIVAP